MLVVGIICLVIGWLLGIGILYTVGWILVAVGLILLLLGVLGHSVGPYRYYW
jgi:hypothetical protein